MDKKSLMDIPLGITYKSLTNLTSEEGSVEDKKFISPKRFIREKFRLQKVGVTEVFLLVKVVSDFDFGHFLEN